MADTVEYVVRIVGLGGGGDDTNESKQGEKNNGIPSGLDGLQAAMHPIQSILSHKKDESPNVYFGKEIAKNTISTLENVTTTSINRYFRMSEDYVAQNNLNNVMGNINRAKQLAGSTLSGAMSGAQVGGAPGAIIGATIGGVSAVANQVISYNNTIIEYKTALNATNIEKSFRAERAGLYDGGKDTEN